MAKDPPERFSISLPADADLDLDQLDEIVEASEYETRSEYIREAILYPDEDD
jgi:metal-responsive CopG/Arc/MetJ family transcriptional regulator